MARVPALQSAGVSVSPSSPHPPLVSMLSAHQIEVAGGLQVACEGRIQDGAGKLDPCTKTRVLNSSLSLTTNLNEAPGYSLPFLGLSFNSLK